MKDVHSACGCVTYRAELHALSQVAAGTVQIEDMGSRGLEGIVQEQSYCGLDESIVVA
jgi:hypothetical protein